MLPNAIRIGSESDHTPESEAGSNERTNERTNASDRTVDPSCDSPKRRRAYEPPEGFATPGAVIEAGQLWRTETRHPRIRTGERDPIPLYVRLAIWYRDRGECDEAPCPPTPHWEDPRPTHLDHIKPWSAGGTDFIDFARPKRPVTWWCHRCHDLDYLVAGKYLDCPQHRWGWGDKPRCRVARASLRWDDASWFIRPVPEDYPHIAYCAHCDAPGMTGVLL